MSEIIDRVDANNSIKDDVLDIAILKECFEKQIMEVEMIQSMYSNPGEFLLYNHNHMEDINNYLSGIDNEIPRRIDYVLKLNCEDIIFELCVNLPLDYPNTEPDVFVRSNNLSRCEQHRLNNNISLYTTNLERGETCVYSVISWLQENAKDYLKIVDEPLVEKEITMKREKFSRFWIYSHHIYSKSKRDEILNLAGYYNISGFCLPGKPGIICIEGDESDCEEWWSKIRSLNWKKITVKYLETHDCDHADRLFKGFSELHLSNTRTSKTNDHHMDMGELLKYLEQHNCAYAFNYYFGLN